MSRGEKMDFLTTIGDLLNKALQAAPDILSTVAELLKAIGV